MDLKLNENQLKISGRCNIISGLTLGKNYDLTIKDVECRKSEEIPTDDGEKNIIYTLRISNLSEVNIIGEGEIIQTKKKKCKEIAFCSGSRLNCKSFYSSWQMELVIETKRKH